MGIIDSIERLRAGLDYHLARHNLLTTNLAHVDTPGYRPVDLAQRTTFKGTLHTAMAATEPGHIESPRSAQNAWEVIEDAAGEAGADGNGVHLDREAVKVASNNLRYDALSTLVAGQLSLLTWAANDGRNG